MKIPGLSSAQRWLLAVAAALVLFIQFRQFELYYVEGWSWVIPISVAVGLLFLALHRPPAQHVVAAEPKQRSAAEGLSVAARADRNVGLLVRMADGMERDAYGPMDEMPPELANAAADARSFGRCWLELYFLGLFLILRSRTNSGFIASEEYRATKTGLLSRAAHAIGSSPLASIAPMGRDQLAKWLASEATKVEHGCVDFGRRLAAGDMKTPASALVAWLIEQTGIRSVNGLDLHEYTTEKLRTLQAEIS